MKVFEDAARHMVKGLMLHKELMDYFNFVGFHMFAVKQKERYLEESGGYADFCFRYMRVKNKLLPQNAPDYESIIPENWYKYTRQEVDNGTRRSALKTGMTAWIDWEKETLALYETFAHQLRDEGKEECALIFEELIREVSEELHNAEAIQLKLEGVGYNIADVYTIIP